MTTEHNRKNYKEIPESVLDKILSTADVINSGLSAGTYVANSIRLFVCGL